MDQLWTYADLETTIGRVRNVSTPTWSGRQGSAWLDVERNQIESFGTTPFFLGIGNHETIAPKGRDEYVATFADWLNAPAIRDQRLSDDAHDRTVRAYYHWMRDRVDFISLDNAVLHQFDSTQIKWLTRVLQNDQQNASVRAIVVGMHEALPESLARDHSMSDAPTAEASGLQVYEALLEVRKTKPVYVLASHSHFVMEDIFDTSYWHEHGGILPGWIIGTGGAVRYPLPRRCGEGKIRSDSRLWIPFRNGKRSSRPRSGSDSL